MTIVTKIKPGGGFKCRLCLCGDQSQIDSAFASAPTATREFLRIVSILFVNSPLFRLFTTDVSKSFLQSDHYHASGRVIGILPNQLRVRQKKWGGVIYADQTQKYTKTNQGRLTQRGRYSIMTTIVFSSSRFMALEMPLCGGTVV